MREIVWCLSKVLLSKFYKPIKSIFHRLPPEYNDMRLEIKGSGVQFPPLIICNCRNTRQISHSMLLNFWNFTSYCILKPLWSGMGEVVPARTSPTLHPPSPPTVHQLSWLALWELNFNSMETQRVWERERSLRETVVEISSWCKMQPSATWHKIKLWYMLHLTSQSSFHFESTECITSTDCTLLSG